MKYNIVSFLWRHSYYAITISEKFWYESFARPGCQKSMLPSTDWNGTLRVSYSHASMPYAKFESGGFFSFWDIMSQNLPGKMQGNGFNCGKKWVFMSEIRSFRPKIGPPCQFQQFSRRANFFHFQMFWDISMRKEQHQPPDWPILLKLSRSMS